MSKTEKAPGKMMFNRAFRGSCANNSPQYARRARDCGLAVDHRSLNVGVRLVDVIDDAAPTASWSDHAFRGSSWSGGPQYAQAGERCRDKPDVRYSAVGVRLIEVIDEQD